MSDNNENKVHWSFWIIGAVALIWNGLGSLNFLMQLGADNLDMYRPVERAIIDGRPLWATGGFALSVVAGALGGLLLLLRRSLALPAFALSLAGALLTTVHSATVDAAFSTAETVVILILPNVVAALLLGYAKFARDKGWVR